MEKMLDVEKICSKFIPWSISTSVIFEKLDICKMIHETSKRSNYSDSFAFTVLFDLLRILPFVNHKGKDLNSDWLADQWDERSILGHAQFHKGGMKGDDPEIDTARTPKRFDGRRASLGEIRKIFTDSIPKKSYS